MPSKKRFDKKKADSYTIVHRSQQDPATHDEELDASLRILHPQKKVHSSSIRLPDSILASEGVELPRHEQPNFTFGLIEVDEDVLQALEDEEGDYEELDDDFVKMAQMGGKNDMDEVDAVISRPNYAEMDLGEQRNILEERFEKVLEQYLSDDGSSEGEEEGLELDERLEGILDEFLEGKELRHEDGVSEDTRRVIEGLPARKKQAKEEFEYLKVKESAEFDCESITSTYSNLYNHPKLIEEPERAKIRLSSKSGLPLGVLNDKPKKAKESQQNKGEGRKQDETAEEKKQRKKQVKEERKEKRQAKKNLKQMYKAEQIHQQQVQAAVPQVSALKL